MRKIKESVLCVKFYGACSGSDGTFSPTCPLEVHLMYCPAKYSEFRYNELEALIPRAIHCFSKIMQFVAYLQMWMEQF